MFINDLKELKDNLKNVEYYLHSTQFDQNRMIGYIQRGRVFVAYKTKDDPEYHFAPSRFVGYEKNTFEKHYNNEEKDGRDTNEIITNILKKKPEYDANLEKAYIDYCNKLHTTAMNFKRSYWILDDEI